MESLFVLKGQLQRFYAKYSKIVDKTVQFVLALVTFYMINRDIGFMKELTNPVITLGLAVVCTFLPSAVTVLAAAVMIFGIHGNGCGYGSSFFDYVYFLHQVYS